MVFPPRKRLSLIPGVDKNRSWEVEAAVLFWSNESKKNCCGAIRKLRLQHGAFKRKASRNTNKKRIYGRAMEGSKAKFAFDPKEAED